MTSHNIEIVKTLLEGATNPEIVNRLMAKDAVYVSLTRDDPELKISMPWAGTHRNGCDGMVETFQTLSAFWSLDDFSIRDIFGDEENVAVFGSFTAQSDNFEKIFVSPFAIQAKLKDGLVTYLLYMEDTLGPRARVAVGN